MHVRSIFLMRRERYCIFIKTGERLIRIFSCPDHQPAAILHPVLNRLNIVMQVTVGNSGADFTGTVQVIFAGFDSGNF